MKCPILVLLLVARLSAQEASPDAALQETVDIQQAHYVAVEKELRAAPVDQLTPAQQAQRTWALDALDCYVTGREYGVDQQGLQGRVPWFRDPHGRLCAVGYMAWVSGEHALVDRLAATRNHDWAVSLLEDPELAAWAARMGLAPLEIERIHAPSIQPSGAESQLLRGSGAARAFNRAARNADAKPAPSSATGPRGAGAPSASGGPAAGTGADSGRAAQSNRTGGADLDPLTGGDEMDDWWLWWEINKSSYLLGPRNEPALAGITGTGGASDRLAALRAAALPLLADALEDGQSIVRAAAASSLGRLGGDQAVDALQAALRDPAQSVREAALLALGATGSPRAAELLLAIATDGRDPATGDELGPAARALAVTALGLARGRGLGAEFDPRVAHLAQGPRPDVGVGTAALLYSRLADTSVMDGVVDDLAHTRDVDLRLRCRVTESLRLAEASDLPPALDELGAPHADRRRSAAVALARAQTPFALPPLQTACELERDPLTRGLLLVSVGERGGPAARKFLLQQLEHGRALDRPWIALGLGLLARRDADDLARSALRQGLADAHSSEAAGAWILGCGLAQDPQARGPLATALAEATDPRQRMFAALSLAMIRDEVSLAALRERLPLERSPLARAGLLLAIGLQGRSADVPVLLAELQTAIDPVLQGQVATALGESGNIQAAEGLAALLADPGALFPTAHAAALDALGLLLDREPGFQLVAAAVDRNFAVFPDWLARALVSTSL